MVVIDKFEMRIFRRRSLNTTLHIQLSFYTTMSFAFFAFQFKRNMITKIKKYPT